MAKIRQITVTILILIDGFLQFIDNLYYRNRSLVTILILIDGFLQSKKHLKKYLMKISHNPYFNRWFSAIQGEEIEIYIEESVTILILIDGFLQFEY